MIYEFSTELLIEMMRTDNYIRAIVLDGIPHDHLVDHVKLNEHGNLEVLTKDVNGTVSLERKSITLRNLMGTCAEDSQK